MQGRLTFSHNLVGFCVMFDKVRPIEDGRIVLHVISLHDPFTHGLHQESVHDFT